jgi:lysophospholipase L1-like esterase
MNIQSMKLYLLIVFQWFYCFGFSQTEIVWWRLESDTLKQFSGLPLRFISNAPEISIRYRCVSSVVFKNMAIDAAKGIDLYAIDSDGLWHRAIGSTSFADTVVHVYKELRPNDNFHKLGREYELYLPLSCSIADLQIGVPVGCLFTKIPERPEKPIVILGSSSIQGVGASRPGMAWTNILTRRLDRNVIRRNFSDKGLVNKSVADLVTDLDPRIFILDFLNDTVKVERDSIHVVQAIVDAIKTIRSKYRHTPILFSEHPGYSNGYLLAHRQIVTDRLNRILQAALQQLKKENIQAIHLLSQREIGIGIDDMSDGEHLNDMGMMQYAIAFEKKLRDIFHEPIGTLKTQIPIRQRRTPQGYDWEGRHRTMLSLNKTESNKILLIGNSITHNWGGKPNTKSNASWQKYLAPYDVRNFGYGADRIENVLWRIYHDELLGIDPEKIFINIGTNNLRVNSNEEIIEGLRFLVQILKIHQPNAEITLLGIYPRRDYEDRIILINTILRKMTAAEHVRFADIGKDMFLETGKVNEKLFTDGLHPNADGYEKLGKQLQVLLKK